MLRWRPRIYGNWRTERELLRLFIWLKMSLLLACTLTTRLQGRNKKERESWEGVVIDSPDDQVSRLTYC